MKYSLNDIYNYWSEEYKKGNYSDSIILRYDLITANSIDVYVKTWNTKTKCSYLRKIYQGGYVGTKKIYSLSDDSDASLDEVLEEIFQLCFDYLCEDILQSVESLYNVNNDYNVVTNNQTIKDIINLME